MTKLSLIAAAIIVMCGRSALADTRQECIAASSDAQDLRRDNKLLQARSQLLICAREQCPAVIKRDCVEWLSQVDASMPTIVVAVRDAAGADVVSARVLLDGAAFLDSIDGKARSINPGVHKLRVEASTAPPLEQELVIREGEKNRLVEVRLPAPTPAVSSTVTPPTTKDSISTGHTPTPIDTAPNKPKVPKPVTVAPVPKSVTPKPEPARGSGKFAAYVVGGSAVPLLVGALGFELWGRSLYDDARGELSDQARRDALYESANLRRYVGEGLAVASVGCLAVAVWLYVRSRRDDTDRAMTTSTRLAPVAAGGHAGLSVVGTF